MRRVVLRYLMRQGFSPHYKGFYYLLDALLYTIQFAVMPPAKEVYLHVAKKNGKTWQSIERGIRNLIQHQSPEANVKNRDQTKIGPKKKDETPYNSRVMAELTVRIRLMTDLERETGQLDTEEIIMDMMDY